MFLFLVLYLAMGCSYSWCFPFGDDTGVSPAQIAKFNEDDVASSGK
jgi:hypothetical protein